MIQTNTTEPAADSPSHGNAPGTPSAAVVSAGAKKAVSGPATGAVVGTSVIVLLVELARSGALEQYKDLLAPLIGWGPGLLIVAGFIWLAHSYAPPLIESQRSTATALQKLADTVEHNSGSQHDLVLAMQVNSDKLEQVRSSVAELQQHCPLAGANADKLDQARQSVTDLKRNFPLIKFNADKLEQVSSSVTDLQQNFQQIKINADEIEQVRSSVTNLQQHFQQFKEDWLNAHKQ